MLEWGCHAAELGRRGLELGPNRRRRGIHHPGCSRLRPADDLNIEPDS